MENGIRYRLAIVIVSYNSFRDIERSARSALKFRGRNDIVIVVDNASSDGTRLVLDRLKASEEGLKVILLEKNIGFGPANNVGFNSVSAEWYFLLNADAWLISDSLEKPISLIEVDPKIAICGLPLVFPDGSPQTFAYSFTSWRKWLLQLVGVRSAIKLLAKVGFLNKLFSKLHIGRFYIQSLTREQLIFDEDRVADYCPTLEIHDVDWVCGAAMLIKGGFVECVSGFDENIFLYGEDEDICLAAHIRGERVVWCDCCPVVHVFGWGENKFSPMVADLKYRSLNYFIRKNYKSPVDRFLMKTLLPFHVYGWKGFFYVLR